MRLVVRAVVVHYQMQRLILGKLPIQAAEKFQPFLVTVPWVAFTDHLAVQHVERRKQRRGAIAFVVVRIVPQRPFFSGSPGCVRSNA